MDEPLFIRTLKAVNNNLDEWRYAGSPDRIDIFEETVPGLPKPDPVSHCICGAKIKHEHCIHSNGHLFTIGGTCLTNHCTKAYREYCLTRNKRCAHCNEPTRAKKDEYCCECRGGILDWGKYKGYTFRKILNLYPEYCAWAMNENSEFSDWLNENVSGIIGFGKYRGKLFRWVLDHDESYCTWIINLTNTTGKLLEFQNWLNAEENAEV